MTRAILLAAALAVAAAPPAQAQQTQTGALRVSVKNKLSGEPMPGAQVTISGARTMGGQTNDQGLFLQPAMPVGSYTVVVTFLGYSDVRTQDVTIRVGATTPMEIVLEEAVLTLQELVVTGVTDPTAGIKVPFTVSRVTTEQLQVPATNSALASIQGKVAGANIVRSSGKPGAGVNILLRSPTSFEESNSPLFVVDGVVIARDLNATTADIEALDIVDIEIIKGAAAASLYGSRAAAGVVSITTNRGLNQPRGATRISMRTEFGKEFLAASAPVTHAHHYRMNADGTALADADGNPVLWGDRTVRTVAEVGGGARMMDQQFPGQIYDNMKALYRPDQFLTNSVTVSQNMENTTFLVGITRFDQRGAMANNDGFWRNTGRFTLDHRVGTNLSFSFTGNHSRTWEDDISSGGTTSTQPYYAAIYYPPFVDLAKKDENGNYMQAPDPSVDLENPLWRQATRDNYTSRVRTWGNASARYSPLTWLTFNGQLSYDRADTKEQVYVPKGVPLDIEGFNPSNGQLTLVTRANNAYNGAFGLTFARQFGDLNARLATRGTFEQEDREQVEAEGRDFIVEGVRDLSAAATLYDMHSSTTDIRANGVLADLALDFRDRYIASFLIRHDGSSLFGPLERWHTYRRASAAYIISREEWFNLPFINELKLRYAMGEAGGRPSFSSQYETWSVSRTQGLSKNTAGNPSLKPQFTREHDVGIDMIGFNNRFQLELVYATQTSTDQIILVPASVISGYTNLYANAALVKGRTYEATMTAYPIRTQNFTWSINAVADNSETKLVEWERSCFWGSNVGRGHERTCAGERAGDFWMRKTVRDPSDLPSWLQGARDEFVVNDEGYLVWVGKRADGTPNSWRDGIATASQAEFCAGSSFNVNNGCGWGSFFSTGGQTYRWGEPFRAWDEENDEVRRVNMGSSLPDLGFGFGSNMRYKGFSTYLGFRGQIGGKVYNNAKQYLYDGFKHRDLDQTGRPDELKKTVDYYERGIANGNSGYIDSFLEDGTYLKLGEARVSYRLAANQTRRVLGSLAPSELTFGLNARNLFTLTNYSGFDPEAGSPLSRVDNIRYPYLRSLTATVDITF
ncbi:MAG TPA: SusC/RagA family TonB-linked outer membrane protein [Longimicrobiales bacterium]|nr:SusC/RagA family TonB-linked outer membrane protein [Longimicrobiales bacterium]